MAKCDFLGKVFTSKNYGDFKVVEYLGSKNIKIVFLNTGYQTTVAAETIRKGSVKDRLAPSVCGVGVVGEEVHSDKDGKPEYPYVVWRGMIQRCYSEGTQARKPTYIGCTVDKPFHYYPTFKAWFLEQPYYDTFELDKDLLVEGNTVYSPTTCTMLPAEINSALANVSRFGCCSLIRYAKRKQCYELDLTQSICGSKEYYKTYKEAFTAYKISKEAQIKSLAEKWKSYISKEAYTALINYTLYVE